MGQWYNIECDCRYNGPAKYNVLKTWLEDNIEGVDFDYDHFSCWGENPYGFEEELLKQLSAAGNLERAELDAHRSDDGSIRYIWNSEKKNWDCVNGKMCFNTNEAEAEFGKSDAYRKLADAFASYVNNDFEANYDREYCREALASAGCDEELAKEIGLGFLFDD